MIELARLEALKALRWALYRLLRVYPSPGAIDLVLRLDEPLRKALRRPC